MKEKIHLKLNEINTVLMTVEKDDPNLFISSGGASLFHYHYTKHNATEKNQEFLEQQLIHFLNNYESPLPSFVSGLSGNIWLINYFAGKEILDDLLGDVKKEINQFLITASHKYTEQGNYDFLHGSLGLIYTASYCKNNVYKKTISELTASFLNNMRKNEKGCFFFDWMSSITNSAKSEKINFSLAHGLPSAAAILSGLQTPDTLDASNNILRFIKSHKSNSSTLSLYPSVVNEAETINYNSRLAWCYGDLGIASAFWQTGKNNNNVEWKQEAINIMLHAAKRLNTKENLIMDAGICHGAAGVAHIFNRFYKETSIREFDEARWYWLDQTLQMAKPNSGLAGYQAWDYKNGWQNEYGLLEGIAGIGLVLMGFLTDDVQELDWDKCLLLS